MKPTEAVIMLAGRIQETFTEACLKYGEAINAAEKSKGTDSHERLVAIARRHALELAELSSAVAARLRPR